MNNTPKVKKILKRLGYLDTENIGEFWFNNRRDATRMVDSLYPTISQTLDLQMRWRTALGVVCQNCVREYIKNKIELANNATSDQNVSRDLLRLSITFARITFDDFSFDFDGTSFNLIGFAQSFETSQVGGIHDLRGIDLSGLVLTNAIVVNAMFSNSNFSRSYISQCEFFGCNFVKADFSDARIVSARINNQSSFGCADFSGAFLNALSFDDSSIRSPFNYSEIGYFDLLDLFIHKSFGWSADQRIPRATTFLLVDVSGLKDTEMLPLVDYVNWYQSLMRKLDSFQDMNCLERIALSFEVVLTKYWRSYLALAWSSVAINLVFAVIFFLNADWFQSFPDSFSGAIYFSFLNFISVGSGKVEPICAQGMIFVGLNFLVGYIVLGVFIFLLSKKISLHARN